MDDVQARSGLDHDKNTNITVTKKVEVDPVTAKSTMRSADGSRTTSPVRSPTKHSGGDDATAETTTPSSTKATPAPSPTPTPPPPKVKVAQAKAVEVENEAMVDLPSVTKKAYDKAVAAFTSGDFGKAIDEYSLVIDDLNDETSEGMVAWKCKLFTSRSDCYLQTGQERLCCNDCTAVLELRPSYPKALLNRAKGMREREKFRDAFTDFQNLILLKHQPSLADAKRGMDEMVKLLNQTGDRDWVRKNRQV